MASNKINIVISAEDKASKPLRAVADEMDNGTNSSDRLGSSFGKLGTLAGVAAAATGVAAVAAAKFAISSAADYEQSLSIFQSVSGATAEQMKEVAARSRELGKDISLPGVSAKDASLAMVELAKAGLTVNDSLAASKGVLSLAKAGQMETAVAAEIAANALMSFGLKGEEANRVADLLAAAANASSAGVHDLGISLSQASAVAAMTKRPVEDVIAQLAMMANAGLKGSDAGTSVKSMLMALISPASTAASAMEDIGFKAHDSSGKLKSTRQIIQDMTKALEGKTDAQRDSALADIFGSDGIRAASIIMKDGVAGYDKMTAAVTKQGAATDLAAAQNAGFNGALDALKSSVETVAIDIGMKLLPSLTKAATYLASNVEPAFAAVTSILSQAKRVITDVGTEVAAYLGPKLSSLWLTVSTQLAPSLFSLYQALEPLLPIAGVALVLAIGLLTDTLNLAVGALSAVTSGVAWVIEEFTKGNPIIIGLAGVFGTLAAAMAFNAVFNALSVGFATLTLVTIPSAMASVSALGALIAAPIVMPAIAIGAALAAIAAVWNAYNEMKAAVEGAKRAADADLATTRQIIAKNAQIQASGVLSPEYKAKWQNVQNNAMASDKRLYGNATGTTYSPGGRTRVGEHGPEDVIMPRGAQVIPAYRSREQRLTGGGVNIEKVIINNQNGENPRRIFEEIGFALELAS